MNGLDLNNLCEIPTSWAPLDLPLEPSKATPVATPHSAVLGPANWPPQLVFDLGMGLDDYATIAERHGLTSVDIENFFRHKLFRREVANMTRDLREDNKIFRAKCKSQAETYLLDMHELMGDPDTPSSTKLSIFQTLTKLGELEPPQARQQEPDNQQQININIAMERAEKRVIDITAAHG